MDGPSRHAGVAELGLDRIRLRAPAASRPHFGDYAVLDRGLAMVLGRNQVERTATAPRIVLLFEEHFLWQQALLPE